MKMEERLTYPRGHSGDQPSFTREAIHARDSMSLSAADLTVEDVRRLLMYDPASGVFRWRAALPRNKKPAGAIAGAITTRGYWKLGILKKTYLAHRVAWFYVHGRWPIATIDHIDGNPLNNAIANLREASIAENSRNVLRQGYFQDKRTGRFTARIQINKHFKFLGSFETMEEAISVYLSATERYFGEFSVVQSRGVNYV